MPSLETDVAVRDGFALRLATAADEPSLRAIHARQLRYTGFQYAWPELFTDPRYFRVYVLELDGKVQGSLVAHATTELFVIADRPRILRALLRRKRRLECELAAAGADELHAFVPVSMLSRMRQFLKRMGMAPTSATCRTFYRSLSTTCTVSEPETEDKNHGTSR